MGEPKLSLVRQCALLGISRSSLYYLPTEAGAEDLELMALIDQQYLKTPFYGSRRMTAWLRNHGHQVNRKRVRWLMQGSQFTSMLLAQGVQVSMDRRGRCMDKVFVERLWRSIKYEEVYLKAYQNGTEARKGIGAYPAFYNQERSHQALGYRSPGQVF